MRRRATSAIILTGMTASLGAPASAQTHVGANPNGGLHWHVAAPQQAVWSLICRFRPITYEASRYDKLHWVNRLERQGQGPQAGRLPGDNGRCRLTKTGGPGPVGLALVKNGVATAAGTNDPARPAVVTVL